MNETPLRDRVSNLRVYQDMMTQAIMTGWSPSDASMEPDPRLGSSPVGMAMDMHAAYKEAWKAESERLAELVPDHALDDFWNMTVMSFEEWEKDMRIGWEENDE